VGRYLPEAFSQIDGRVLGTGFLARILMLRTIFMAMHSIKFRRGKLLLWSVPKSDKCANSDPEIGRNHLNSGKS
jgi:hypothetical protein